MTKERRNIYYNDRLVGFKKERIVKMTPKIINRQEKKEKILRAALKVFSHKGMNEFKIIDVAQAAGIGKGTIYEYFSKKEDIITGCFDVFMHDLGEAIGIGLSKISDPKEKIVGFFALSFKYSSQNQELMGVLFDFWAAAIPRKDGVPIISGIKNEYLEFQKIVTGILNDGIKQGLFKQHNTKTTALIILAILDGLFFQAVLGVIDFSDKSLPKIISNTILEGILND